MQTSGLNNAGGRDDRYCCQMRAMRHVHNRQKQTVSTRTPQHPAPHRPPHTVCGIKCGGSFEINANVRVVSRIDLNAYRHVTREGARGAVEPRKGKLVRGLRNRAATSAVRQSFRRGFRHSRFLPPRPSPEPAGDPTDDRSLHVDRRPQLASREPAARCGPSSYPPEFSRATNPATCRCSNPPRST